ncbi:helix-turn-helix transcriptional regulator [Halospeciosus flavus]|uniref:Helix-turn-helix transcriptional regulator n=1 Tax=Halospeciosus flavus TaxID=3032283 RepID=A0ABD5Z4L7_9EURY|nr:GntR family transcriptional regulator [Halospeciosus flavus]
MESRDAEEVVEMLARRSEILRTARDGPRPKRALVEDHDVSRSTVDRAVRELESAGFLERRDGDVSLTLSGRLALDGYEELVDALTGLNEAEPILETLPADTSFCVELLRGATVVESEPHAPHRPVSVLDDILQQSTTVLSYSTMVVPELVERYRDVALGGDCSLEVVANPPVVDTLVTDYAEPLDEAIQSGNVELYETANEGPRYSFLVADRGGDDWVGATLHGERGITGVLENDRDEAVEWLLDRYEALRSDAERLA